MFLDWSGRGYVVGLIGVGCVFGGCLATEEAFGKGYWASNAWTPSASCAAAGLLTWLFSRLLDERAYRRRAAEVLWRQPPTPRPRDTFCWVPVRYWPAIYLGLAVVGIFMWGKG